MGDILNRSFWKSDAEIDAYYGRDAAEQGASAQRAALAAWQAKIHECRNLPPDKAIPVLGEAIQKISKSSIFQVPERIEIYDEALALLLSLPGHAEYYGNKIREWKAKASAKPESYSSEYLTQRMWAFATLEQMPSPETVRVLAGFFDDRDYTMDESTGMVYEKASCGCAVKALCELLANPPAQPGEGMEPWFEWRDSIQQGRASYRLKGSNILYDFNGPVGTWKPPGQGGGTGSPRSGSGTPPGRTSPAHGGSPAESSSTPSSPVWPWAAGIVVLTTAGWWWLCRRGEVKK